MLKRLVVIAIVALMAAPSFGQLAGYWKFDEPNGSTVADSSGNGNTGTLYAVDSSNYPAHITGHNGNALLFNADTTSSANSNRVNVPVGTGTLVNLGEAFTISMWVRRDAVVLSPTIVIAPGLIYTNVYELDLATDPNADPGNNDSWDYFYCDSSYDWQLSLGIENATQKTLGSWYHYAVTYDGNYLRKFVNGVFVNGTVAPTTFSLSASGNLLIGARSDDGYFSGALDDVAVWSGKYLTGTEIAKLANGTATPFTVVESDPNPPLSQPYYVKEQNNGYAWLSSGWKLFWDNGFNQDVSVSTDNIVDAWWFSTPLTMPGVRVAVDGLDGVGYCKWYPRNQEDYSVPDRDASRYGAEWIDPSWSGRAPDVAVIAAYFTPGIMICQNHHGYQAYDPNYDWMQKDFFKTYARVAVVNPGMAQLRVRVYTYAIGATPWVDPGVLTYLGEVYWPLYYKGDYIWQELKYAFPKPKTGVETPVWVEISIVNGNPDTVVYIDEFNPISDQANTGQHHATYKAGDFDEDAIVNFEDLGTLTDQWLETCSSLDPRSGGLLANGDFTEDTDLVGWEDDANIPMNPSGWSFSGTGNYGLWRTAKRGGLNFVYWTEPRTIVPAGGDISAFTTDMSPGDPNGVLSQTASVTAVSGQTYYAMGYVMTWFPGTDGPWYGWKDTATMTISIDNVVKATFSRKLSMSKWRALYGTYTAVPADAGKSIKISFSYDNDYTTYYAQAANMYVGYAYLGTTVPDEWPEERENLLINGGFEDLSVIQSQIPALYTTLTTSDNYGAWFATGTPSGLIPGWVYEVPSGYDMANKGGIWASAFYGPPLPTPGLNDITIYVNDDFVLGQVVGPLTSGMTYYLDAACGVSDSNYLSDVNWPNPAPHLRLELWRIPVGVSDGTVIYNGISGGNPSYVKVAEANVAATGDILGSNSARGTPASNWQIIGTSYTGTSLDTNMYVRIRGSGGAGPYPDYAFNDVYLSTQKRMVAGGTQAANISAGVQYDVLGPYNSYHADLMGLCSIEADLNGDGLVDFIDYAIMAQNWVVNWYTNITGSPPWN